MWKREKQFVLKASRPFLSLHPMRDEAAGGLEMIDAPCKCGHYHIGFPPPLSPLFIVNWGHCETLILCNLAAHITWTWWNIRIWEHVWCLLFLNTDVLSFWSGVKMQNGEKPHCDMKKINIFWSTCSHFNTGCVIAFVAAVERLPLDAINAGRWNTSGCKIHMSMD